MLPGILAPPWREEPETLFLRQSLMYHGIVRRHDWLQLTFASVSGVVAYYLWTSQHVSVRPDDIMLTLHAMADTLGDWVRHSRQVFR